MVTKEENVSGLGFEENDIDRFFNMGHIEDANLTLNSQGELELEFPTDDETVDIDMKCHQHGAYVNHDVVLTEATNIEVLDPTKLSDIKFLQQPTCGPPERGFFTGDLKFEVQVNSSDVHKKRYLYSNKLNRIYVDMNVNFSIQFVWESSHTHPMFVRATAVFSDEAQAQKRVERCLQHKHSVTGNDPERVNHVLRSASELGAEGVYYCGDPNKPDSWYSVLIQTPDHTRSSAPFSHAYQFVCKNSCSSGINRRAIHIVFTLEDISGRVYGRQTVGARVCACPRRDMLKDEENEGPVTGKKRVSKAPEVASKKVKIETVDDDEAVFTLPPLQIIGGKTLTTGLQVCLNMMEQSSQYKRNDPKAHEKFTKAITGLKSYIEKVKKAQNPPQ